jgi:hypothetical protein
VLKTAIARLEIAINDMKSVQRVAPSREIAIAITEAQTSLLWLRFIEAEHR